jgi:hypothetical protein
MGERDKRIYIMCLTMMSDESVNIAAAHHIDTFDVPSWYQLC